MTRGSVAGCSLPGFGDGLSRGRVSRRGDALVPLPGFGDGCRWELGPLRCHVTEADNLGVAGNRRQRLREPGTGPMACQGRRTWRPLPQFGDGFLRESGLPRRHVTKDDTLGVTEIRRQRLPAPGTAPVPHQGRPHGDRYRNSATVPAGTETAPTSRDRDPSALPEIGDNTCACGNRGPARCRVTKDDTLGITGNRRQRLPAPGTTPAPNQGRPHGDRYRKSATTTCGNRDRPNVT
ncbi:Hypothetical protein AJAP_31210 [Amycolatopsis japonica]|uniref:Uncharacterized protein n=1 Tax=Amycolatopsis japonica TaxID=208439 RepID=A0A075V3E6_9PSEU|nr:Hypothetical protein AJAP_31210 [Amycolatopsis japonica]